MAYLSNQLQNKKQIQILVGDTNMSIVKVHGYKGVEIERIKNHRSPQHTETLMKEAAIDKVVEINDLEVPQDQIDEEVTTMVIELNHRLKYESLATGAYISLSQEDREDYLAQFNREAFKLVKTRLVIKAIINEEKFTLSKDELEAEAIAMAARQQTSVDEVKKFLGEDLEMLRSDLLIRKAIDFVYTHAVIT